MKKYLFFLTFSMAFFSIAQAQTAQEWLDRVSATYNKANSYYIKFELKDGNSKTEIGEIFAVKEKYSLEILDIQQMYDGKTLYTISKDDKEITVSKPAPNSDDFLTPTKVLALYKTNFKASLDKTATVGGKSLQYIKMTPSGKAEADYVMVAIDTKNNTLYEYKEFLKGGGTRTIQVKEYLENLIIPKSLFKFDQPKFEKDGYIVTQL